MPQSGDARFFVDENLLGVGKALVAARSDVVYPGYRHFPDVKLGALDTEWMPVVSKRDLVVISRDKRIRTRHAEQALFRSLSLRAVWIAGKKDLTNWDCLCLLVKRWPELEREIAARGSGPWFLALSDSRGFQAISV